VAGLVQASETTAVGHFLDVGQFEDRDPHPLFDTNFYLSDSELAAALEAAGLTAIEHFINFGQFEGRDPSVLFDTNFYLQQNPEVEGLINDGLFESAIQHFIEVGLQENSLSTPPELTDSLFAIDGDFGSLGNSEVSDFVGNEDPVDIYSFLLDTPSNLQVVLGGLTADADLELIEDFNGNNVIDSLEIFATSKQLGTQDEQINTDLLPPGNYFVRVSQFEGDTNYNLSVLGSPSS
ncbi:MAG: PPC domain-containing protein, partial [Cyanobacteriota bacterium]|nr:PPC domain-containing protein [Cyanobacteriota bacterium]